ncbi:MAG: hypothetical protein KW793_00495 [Candidatus Doudnabacteria bacterium]|nr:hypothetical protein [Candidatus Doudnabacteria bacterium]
MEPSHVVVHDGPPGTIALAEFVRNHVPEGVDWILTEETRNIFAKASIAGIVTTEKSVEQTLVRIRRDRKGEVKRSNKEKYLHNLNVLASTVAEKDTQLQEARGKFLAEVEKNKTLQKEIDYLKGFLLSVQVGIRDVTGIVATDDE